MREIDQEAIAYLINDNEEVNPLICISEFINKFNPLSANKEEEEEEELELKSREIAVSLNETKKIAEHDISFSEIPKLSNEENQFEIKSSENTEKIDEKESRLSQILRKLALASIFTAGVLEIPECMNYLNKRLAALKIKQNKIRLQVGLIVVSGVLFLPSILKLQNKKK